METKREKKLINRKEMPKVRENLDRDGATKQGELLSEVPREH